MRRLWDAVDRVLEGITLGILVAMCGWIVGYHLGVWLWRFVLWLKTFPSMNW